jgi:hypothetical protein
MSLPLSELGKSLKCPKCPKEWGEIFNFKLSDRTVELNFRCKKCGVGFQRTYSINQFIRMAEAGLIEPKTWIVDFQKKTIIQKGQFIKIADGIDGIIIIRDEDIPIIKKEGQKLICSEKDCDQFFKLTFEKFKKDNIVLKAYCPCKGKTKKIEMEVRTFLILGKARVIDSELISHVKEEFTTESKGFDVDTMYGLDQSILAPWVQEALGLTGDSVRTKCYICGTEVGAGMDRCPKCGSDL